MAYDRLLADLPGDHPGAVYLKIFRAISSLFEDRLADADETLRRLRGPVEAMPGSPAAAAYRFALLFQAVKTARYDDAIAESDGLIPALQPWGIQAGYGYALLAYCYQQSPRTAPPAPHDSASESSSLAHLWWERATALLSPHALRQRFPELATMEFFQTEDEP